ncbi:unnamed protein product [Durusdinium trenchii]|uniref:Protein kinase domain-containing protein n=1 Tax=Durusdinium trenchii TaxID=1381693 RepID=A0ABP0K9U3_9DINO
MDSDSDDEYWGTYQRLPQETTRLPFSSFSSQGVSQSLDFSWNDPCGSAKLSAGSIGSTPSIFSQETVELEPGALISVGSRCFELHDLLGVGSFGSVWCATCHTSGATVALKEILSLNKESMEAAKLEAQRLHALHDVIQDRSGCAALPNLLAAATATYGNGYRTVMVMEQIPGEPLRQALEGGQLLVPRGDPMAQAVYFASEMLRQLAMVMHPLSKRFLHRDANSQNILVQASSGQYHFGLIDFGLAVDAMSWSCGGWRGYGASGDGRFWTTSSWMLFTSGPEALDSACEDLQSEYTLRTDLHSVGLSALQALVVLSEDADWLNNHGEVAMESLRNLREAWKQYWCYASSCWERVLDAFNRDARGAIKMQLRQELVHETFAAHFTKLHECLLQVRSSLYASKECRGGKLGDRCLALRVVEALLHMISTGRRWTDGCGAWEQVLELMCETSQTWTGHVLFFPQSGLACASFILLAEVRSTARKNVWLLWMRCYA